MPSGVQESTDQQGPRPRHGMPQQARCRIKPGTLLLPFFLSVFILTWSFCLQPSVPEIFLHVEIMHFHPVPKTLG